MRRAAAGGLGLVLLVVACGSKHPPPPSGFIMAEEAGPDSAALTLLPTVAPSDDPTTCAQAAKLRSYVGCDYWPTVVANAVWSVFDFAVVVANAGTAPATVTVTGPAPTHQVQTVQPNSLATFYLPWVPALKGADADECGVPPPQSASVFVQQGAYHLVSSVPVSVYQFSALEYASFGGPPGKDWTKCPGLRACQTLGPAYGKSIMCFSYTNDASLLFPSTAMTGNYRIAGYPGQTEYDPTGNSPPLPIMGSYFAVTATVDGTHVRALLSKASHVLADTGSADGGAPSFDAGAADAGTRIAETLGSGEIDLTMNAGDVAEVVGAMGDTVDLSGSLVAADQPVQVIAGAPCDTIPEGQPACDHLEQSMFPAETLGKQYFVTAPTGPAGSAVGRVVRLYGNADGTILTYAPTAPAGCPTALNAGDVADCGVVAGDFEVTGTHEFAVGSFMQGGSIVDVNAAAQGRAALGDPSESLMTSVEQYRTKYVFLAPSDYAENFADIVAPIGANVVLDGIALETGVLPEIAAGFGVVRVPLVGSSSNVLGAHVLLASAPVGLQVLGYGAYTSYQYPGGLNLKQIAPPPRPP